MGLSPWSWQIMTSPDCDLYMETQTHMIYLYLYDSTRYTSFFFGISHYQRDPKTARRQGQAFHLLQLQGGPAPWRAGRNGGVETDHAALHGLTWKELLGWGLGGEDEDSHETWGEQGDHWMFSCFCVIFYRDKGGEWRNNSDNNP